jgi:FkbH-like protein
MLEIRSQMRNVFAERRSIVFIDSAAIIERLGRDAAIDYRMFFRGKSPYSIQFLDQLARLTWQQSREFGIRYPKALVVDCDNTLWGGVVGEDGYRDIQINPHSYPGNIYWWVQHQLKFLKQNGILLCIASKNEPSDVAKVFSENPEMILRETDFVTSEVSWRDKPSMLVSIAAELNIGLDSIAFLDDSSFEVEAVTEQLPEIAVFQVPSDVSRYPILMDEVLGHFRPAFNLSSGHLKTIEYRQRRHRNLEQARFTTNEDYLRSLSLNVRLVRNEINQTSRLSELTQKTNQFNLTTQRLTKNQVEGILDEGSKDVWSCYVTDAFGESGLTGMVIVNRELAVSSIDVFLLSCRILGRGIESALLSKVCQILFDEGCTAIEASYVPSSKNAQTSTFFEKHGFEVTEASEAVVRYRLVDSTAKPTIPDWVSIHVDG